MLLSESHQRDILVLTGDVFSANFTFTNSGFQKFALGVQNQIKQFHVDKPCRKGLLKIFNAFTANGKEIKGNHNISAFQIMINQLVNYYIDYNLGLGTPTHADILSALPNKPERR